MNSQDLKWEVRKRLEEIERCLYWKGGVQRGNLIKTFGISPQQASADFALYQKLAPENTIFNGSLKRYEPTDQFKAQFISLELADYVQWTECESVTATMPSPIRAANPDVLRAVINTIHNDQSIEIHYQSLSTPKPSVRRLTPHTLVFDGYRYHVRGYCHLRNGFRDFVLGRILEASSPGRPGEQIAEDESWNTNIILRLCPHPDLSPDQKAVIESDYGMSDGELQLRVKQAMLVYMLVQLRLDKFTEKRSAAEQQIILLNPEVLNCLN